MVSDDYLDRWITIFNRRLYLAIKLDTNLSSKNTISVQHDLSIHSNIDLIFFIIQILIRLKLRWIILTYHRTRRLPFFRIL